MNIKQDFVAGLDLTGYTDITAAQLMQLISNAVTSSSRGLNIYTTDDSDGNPDVPDALTITKYQRYLWIRKGTAAMSVYVWNPYINANLSTQKWVPFIDAALADGSIDARTKLKAQSITENLIALSGISWSLIKNAPTFLSGEATINDVNSTLYGSTYNNPVVKAKGITGSMIANDAATDANRAIANDHIKALTIKANEKIAPSAVGDYILKTTTDASAVAWFLDYFAILSKVFGTAFQRPRINAGATALEWVNEVIFQRFYKAVAATSGTGTIPVDASIPQIGEGDALTSQAITPTIVTSLLRVKFFAIISDSAAANVVVALFRDAGADAVATSVVNVDATNSTRVIELEYVVASGALTATTFSVRIGSSAGTWYVGKNSTALFGGTIKSYLTVEETNGTLA